MNDILAFCLDLRSRLRILHGSDQCFKIKLLFRTQAKNRIAIFFIMKNYTLDTAPYFNGVAGRKSALNLPAHYEIPLFSIRFCNRTISISVIAAIALRTGTMRGMAQISCLPPMDSTIFSPCFETVFCSLATEGIGFTYARAIMGCPFEIPPSIPPA